MVLASIGVILGQFALLVDLTNRIWGSHSRTPVGSSARIAFILGVSFLFGLPVYLLVLAPGSDLGHTLVRPFGIVGTVLFLHYVFPYRLGIRGGAEGCSEALPVPLADGILLREVVAEVGSLPDGTDELLCLVCSDFHVNDDRKLERVRGAFEALRRQKWDFVFLLGDFTSSNSLLPAVLDLATSVPSRFGTFCVRGNHDYEHGRDESLPRLLGERRVTLLSNQSRLLQEIGVTLVALEGPWRPGPLPPPVENGLAIGLTHTPDNLRRFSRVNVDIALAGHSHGGKFRLPWLGPVLLPARLGRFLVRGWFQHRQTRMFITTGMGGDLGKPGHAGEMVRLSLRQGRFGSGDSAGDRVNAGPPYQAGAVTGSGRG
jgi:predicted phosphodiesterase